MSNIDNIFKILANNSDDVEAVVKQFGGIGPLIRAAPALLRIMRTISQSKEPVQEAQNISDLVLYYGETTRDRVRAFQRAHGLQADGIVGERTWSAVERMIGRRNSKS